MVVCLRGLYRHSVSSRPGPCISVNAPPHRLPHSGKYKPWRVVCLRCTKSIINDDSCNIWGCVHLAYPFLLWWLWECVYFIIIIILEVWISCHSLGKVMKQWYALFLSMFSSHHRQLCWQTDKVKLSDFSDISSSFVEFRMKLVPAKVDNNYHKPTRSKRVQTMYIYLATHKKSTYTVNMILMILAYSCVLIQRKH